MTSRMQLRALLQCGSTPATSKSAMSLIKTQPNQTRLYLHDIGGQWGMHHPHSTGRPVLWVAPCPVQLQWDQISWGRRQERERKALTKDPLNPLMK